MVQHHHITPAQRAQVVCQMIAHAGDYGLVTHLSRDLGVSRQTLYSWLERGWQAVEAAFLPPPPACTLSPALHRQILTLLVEGHASVRGIQACLRATTGQHVSLGSISSITTEAEQRAQTWMATHAPPTSRAIALDEIYGRKRCGAYLNVVDLDSWAVWAAEGPLPVDADTWTLVLWEAQARGLRWHATVSDGAPAMQQACQVVDPNGQHGRDVWHLLHTCSQCQGRVDRVVTTLEAQAATAQRYAEQTAAGVRPRGRQPVALDVAHAGQLRSARRTAQALHYLTGQLHTLLEVVVLRPAGVVDRSTRQAELDTLLELLAEVRDAAAPGQREHLHSLHTTLTRALPAALAFVGGVERVQQELRSVVDEAEVALIAWAWQRREILGPSTEEVVGGLPEAWRTAARVLMATWDGAARASSAVEGWHSIVRPHLAVHRTLSPGLLALLAVWHNHRVFSRGSHRGASPVRLSGLADAPCDWLVALGYPPATAALCPVVADAAQPLTMAA
jgi:transposase-like protein